MLKPQWWVSCKPMAEDSLRVSYIISTTRWIS
jgi:hypothetical protein